MEPQPKGAEHKHAVYCLLFTVWQASIEIAPRDCLPVTYHTGNDIEFLSLSMGTTPCHQHKHAEAHTLQKTAPEQPCQLITSN